MYRSFDQFQFAGRPSPTLTWWIDGTLVDASSYKEGSDTVVNKLSNMKAER